MGQLGGSTEWPIPVCQAAQPQGTTGCGYRGIWAPFRPWCAPTAVRAPNLGWPSAPQLGAPLLSGLLRPPSAHLSPALVLPEPHDHVALSATPPKGRVTSVSWPRMVRLRVGGIACEPAVALDVLRLSGRVRVQDRE